MDNLNMIEWEFIDHEEDADGWHTVSYRLSQWQSVYMGECPAWSRWDQVRRWLWAHEDLWCLHISAQLETPHDNGRKVLAHFTAFLNPSNL